MILNKEEGWIDLWELTQFEDLDKNKFLDYELDFDGIFSDYQELVYFCKNLVQFGNPVTIGFFTNSLNDYGTNKTINSLIKKGFIEQTYNKEGDDAYRLSELGKRVRNII